MEENKITNSYEYDYQQNNSHSTAVTSINVEIPTDELISLIKWAKFRAVIIIITGAFACLPIITAAFGIPQIIAGVKLLSSANQLQSYISNNNKYMIEAFFMDNKKFFIYSGVSAIIKISLSIFLIAVYIALFAAIFSMIPDFFEQINNDYNLPFEENFQYYNSTDGL